MKKGFLGEIYVRAVFFINAIIIYSLVYCVAYRVPLHSDDYSYLQQGLSLKAHMEHYLGWSGRVITDYTSSLLLNLFKRPVYMAINSAVLLIVVILISIIPDIVSGRRLSKGSPVVLWIIFLLYWIANPNLGQTSFWLVGSANYLWTLMWASIYFSFLLYLIAGDKEVKNRHLIVLFVLGFFAGLSNEALGISVVLFGLCLIPMYWKKAGKCILTGLLSSCIGYGILFFSPGNRSRSSYDGFTPWHELSPFDKLISHVFDRMPDALGVFYQVYLALIIVLIAALWVYNGKKINAYVFRYALIFCVLSVCSVGAFVVSPVMPPRSGNTSLYFALLALSFIANALADAETSGGRVSLYCVAAICAVYFLFSFSFILYAYTQTEQQAAIREEEILEAKSSGSDTAVLPDWYFTRLAKEADKFDLYRADSMADYYGLSRIEWKDAKFNYSVVKSADPVIVNKTLENGVTLSKIYVVLNAPFEQTFVFEFDKCLQDHVEKGENRLYIRLKAAGLEEAVDADLKLKDYMKIGDKYFYGRTILTPNLNGLSTIDFGFYNSHTETKTAEYSLDLKEYRKR